MNDNLRKTGDEQMAAYTEAVKSGMYAKKSGLVGKYDNVRRYWEDEITRMYIRPHMRKLLDRCAQQMQRLRILDLGCGSADGYELLASVRVRDATLEQTEVDLLHPDMLGLYKGTDLNQDLLDQAAEIYGNSPKMKFEIGDFTEGLPVGKDEKMFDLVFSSFGTFSHHNDDQTAIDLLAEIAERTQDYTVVICDWLGRYSYEWQSLWTNDHEELKNMDYVVSYIYEKEEREAKRDELQHLTLRLMSRFEAENIITQASKKAGVKINPLQFFDRSVVTGRHMDTGDYNPYAQPLRLAVNSLHEANMRTDLGDLLFDYVPKEGFDFLNDYFEKLQMCWNTMVHYVHDLLTEFDGIESRFRHEPPDPPASYPEPLHRAMLRMKRLVVGAGWVDQGLPRENIIEPQLGYTLRELVTSLQEGQGAAHGLVGIFEIDKRNG